MVCRWSVGDGFQLSVAFFGWLAIAKRERWRPSVLRVLISSRGSQVFLEGFESGRQNIWNRGGDFHRYTQQ